MRPDLPESRLRERLPTAAPPVSLRARIEASLGDSPPGRERPAPTSRAPWAIAVAAAVVVVAVAPFALQRPGQTAATPTTALQTPVRQSPDTTLATTPDPADRSWPLVQVSNPLTSEATRLWSDVQRLRAGIEGPVRVLAEASRSL